MNYNLNEDYEKSYLEGCIEGINSFNEGFFENRRYKKYVSNGGKLSIKDFRDPYKVKYESYKNDGGTLSYLKFKEIQQKKDEEREDKEYQRKMERRKMRMEQEKERRKYEAIGNAINGISATATTVAKSKYK